MNFYAFKIHDIHVSIYMRYIEEICQISSFFLLTKLYQKSIMCSTTKAMTKTSTHIKAYTESAGHRLKARTAAAYDGMPLGAG